MKLEPKAKPVRIRIKSGGEEHFNLESLKQNFSVQDLWEAVIGKSLSRWLRQQNETELAKKVDEFCHIKELSNEHYIKFSALFFGSESIGSANSLISFYQEKGLKKNFQYAFPYLLESLDYQSGKIWFDKYKDLKSNEDWIAFFEKRLDCLKDEEEIECYRFLSKLHESNHDAKKMEYCLSKAKELATSLAIEDNSIADKWFASKDFFYIDAMYNDASIMKTRGVDEWIEFFEQCKEQFLETDKAKCYFYLALLYQNRDKSKADDYMKESANLGFKEAAKRIRRIKPLYPELTKIINSYRIDKKVAYKDLASINKELKAIEKKNYYFSVCHSCIKLFMETVGCFDEENGRFVNLEYEDLLVRERKLCSSFVQIRLDDNLWRSFDPLIELVSALAWEQKKGSNKLFEEGIDYNCNLMIKLKKAGKKEILKSARGLECDLKNDTIVEQMIFLLETYGEAYSILKTSEKA